MHDDLRPSDRIVQPSSAEEVIEHLLENPIDKVKGEGRVLPRGGSSKSGLVAVDSTSSGVTFLDTRRLTGILAYEPSEFTVTVRAGTPLAEIESALAKNGQVLPFDPPFGPRGATAGGAVASGLAGPGRLRYGGVRDSVLAVRFVDGRGRHARAGAPVVKNAAGFDLPKLFVGSLGRLGVLTEITFKVLPRPASFLTGLFHYRNLEAAQSAALVLRGQPLELDGLELLAAEGESWTLALRVGGAPESLKRRLERIAREVGQEPEMLQDDDEFWRRARDAQWDAKWDAEETDEQQALVSVALPAERLLVFHEALRELPAPIVYSGGLTSAWVAVEPASLPTLDLLLCRLGLGALLVRAGAGPAPTSPILGAQAGEPFLARVKQALDPAGRFLAF